MVEDVPEIKQFDEGDIGLLKLLAFESRWRF